MLESDCNWHPPIWTHPWTSCITPMHLLRHILPQPCPAFMQWMEFIISSLHTIAQQANTILPVQLLKSEIKNPPNLIHRKARGARDINFWPQQLQECQGCQAALSGRTRSSFQYLASHMKSLKSLHFILMSFAHVHKKYRDVWTDCRSYYNTGWVNCNIG